MVALYIIILIQAGIILGLSVARYRNKPSTGNALTSGHELTWVRYKNSDYGKDRGWAWKCSCGAGALINEYNNPTEERALNAWKRHKGLYAQMAVEVGEDKYKILYEDTKAEFEKFKESCYCKDLK